jgi:adenylate cyclase
VLEGSVRKAGQRVRITGKLIDAVSGTHLWADRFDGSLEDVFELQDKVASSVAGVIEPALEAAETVRSAARPTNDLTAYDLYLRAYAMLWSSARHIPEALRLAEQAIACDPRYGPALAWAAYCYVALLHGNQSEDREANRRKAIDFARRALQVGVDDPGVLANAAYALAYFGEDIGAMMALVDRALALNPSFARGWYISGVIKLWAGQPDIAIDDSEVSLRLSPRAPTGPALGVIGGAHFFARRFNEAVRISLLAGSMRPCRSCSSRSRRIRATSSPIVISPPATLICGGLTMREKSSRGCELSALSCSKCCPPIPTTARSPAPSPRPSWGRARSILTTARPSSPIASSAACWYRLSASFPNISRL